MAKKSTAIKTEKEESKKELMSESQGWSHISDLFGDDNVYHPDDLEEVEIISSSSPALDRALAVGGFARGRLYQLAGKPSAGKSLLSLLLMAQWQRQHPENCCCYLDLEYTYDKEWARKLGVDNNRVLLIKTNDGVKIFTGLCGKPKKNQKTGEVKHAPGLLQMAIDGQWITHKVNGKEVKLNLGRLGVVVLDSIAVMQPPQEKESVVGKMNMAPLPRFLNPELKNLTPLVAKSNVVFVALNHVKEKIGEMFGNPETTPGGASWKHACTCMLMVAPLTGEGNVLLDQNEEKYGHKVKVKIEKNKLGPPNKKAEFFIDFNSGVIRKGEELLELGVLYGLIQRPNNRTYIINEEQLTSREKALEYLEQNLISFEEQVRAVYLNGTDTVIAADEGKPETFENPFEDEVEEEIEELE